MAGIGTASVPGGVPHTHGLATLSHAERLAAQAALDKLKQTGGLGSHFGATSESATVSSGLSHTLGRSTVGLGASTLLSARGSDTFMGGVRGALATSGLSIGNDTVVSGSTTKLDIHGRSDTLAGRAQHFTLSTDTINVAGATATSIHAEERPHGTASPHTVTLSDKTTIKIAGLSPHDISKLHH